jgi:hypothetical protein
MTSLTALGILEELGRAGADWAKALSSDSNLATKMRFSYPALLHEVGRILPGGHEGYLDAGYMKATVFKSSQPTQAASNLLDAICDHINLAIFAGNLYTWNGDEVSLSHSIGALDNRFPSQFVSQFFNGQHSSGAASRLINETLSLALDLRTQAAISAFKNGEVRNPAEAFYVRTDGGEYFRQFGDRWAEQETAIQSRVEELQELLHMSEDPQVFSEKFDFGKFVVDGLNWIREREIELKSFIMSYGSFDGALLVIRDNLAGLPYVSDALTSFKTDLNSGPSGGFNASQIGAQKEVFTQSGYPNLLPASGFTQGLGFVNHGSSLPNPGKPVKRKASSLGKEPLKVPKRQRNQQENPIDQTAFDERVMNMSQAGPEASQVPFQPPPTTSPVAPKEPKIQSRVKWTPEEVSALVLYIEILGPQWSKIKDVDNDRYLARRDQVALKDKARNLKFECLKHGRAMYPNFESVTLSQSMRAKLVNMGQPLPPLPSQAQQVPDAHNALEGEANVMLPGVSEYNANANVEDEDGTASHNGDPAFEDAPEVPTQDDPDMPVDPSLVRGV